jgi:hypothetical protein
MVAGEIPIVRNAARVVLLDEASRVLLARFEYREKTWWVAPGGGLEPTETHEEAARGKKGYSAHSGGGRSPELVEHGPPQRSFEVGV